MGYRSEVAIAIATEAVASFEAACPTILRDFGRGYDFGTNAGAPLGRCYTHPWVKWYEADSPDDPYAYPGAVEWGRWREEADVGDYVFIRVGPELDDVEEAGYFYEANMCVERRIELPARPGTGDGNED